MSNIFDEPTNALYDLKIDRTGGVARVAAQELLDILEQRAILALRLSIVPNINKRTADFQRGRFSELSDLYQAVQKTCMKTTI